MISLRSYIKHSKEYFIRYLNTLKSGKKLSCALFFQPSPWCLDILMFDILPPVPLVNFYLIIMHY